LIFTYSDDGRGIPPENLDKIFEPFYTTKRGQGGSGLGLHIIYNIVTQKLGGTISCESEVGVGTRFIIDLPI
jgi:signal transduction histidine kinase